MYEVFLSNINNLKTIMISSNYSKFNDNLFAYSYKVLSIPIEYQ